MKRCIRCNKEKQLGEFNKDRNSKDGRTSYCKLCAREKKNIWYQEHKEYAIAYAKQKRKELKAIVHNHYGNKCSCCGESQPEFLTIHHINNDGAKHRKEISTWTAVMYRWIIDNEFPSSFTLLCFNCNCALQYFGYCPHKK